MTVKVVLLGKPVCFFNNLKGCIGSPIWGIASNGSCASDENVTISTSVDNFARLNSSASNVISVSTNRINSGASINSLSYCLSV